MLVSVLCVFIFFFKQKTAYEMRISDWSSDVCSSDLDLLEIIASSGLSSRLCAIARRSSLGETISDAIVLRNDRPAVSALLANGSAQIREETLDRLIEASVQEPAWQPALVARPVLPAGAVRKLAGFVADRSEEHTSELPSLMRDQYAFLFLPKK